jgi:NlpC/P60 family
MSISVTEITSILTYMLGQVGKSYTEQNPERFGPSEFDCSGLVWAALQHAGINIPQSDAIASSEAQWAAAQPGAQVIKSESQIQRGDLVFFTGASPDPSTFGPIGHVGMATSSTEFVSAYDTALGVKVLPINEGGGFVVGVRLGGSPASTTPSSGGGLLSIPSEIISFFSDADKYVNGLMWLIQPGSWVRIGAFLAGVALFLFAIHAFIAASSDKPIVSMPSTIPLPVPV